MSAAALSALPGYRALVDALTERRPLAPGQAAALLAILRTLTVADTEVGAAARYELAQRVFYVSGTLCGVLVVARAELGSIEAGPPGLSCAPSTALAGPGGPHDASAGAR